MGVAVLQHRVSFHPSSYATPPPKPSRAAHRAERSSPPSAPRSAPKATATTTLTPSPAKPATQPRPGRGRSRVQAEDSPSTRRSGGGMVAKQPSRNLVMGEVTILKRGDDPKATPAPAPAPSPSPSPSPSPAPAAAVTPPPAPKHRSSPPPLPLAERSSEEASKADDVVFSSTERLGPAEPEILPKQICLTKSQVHKTSVYAGSAFIASPSPSCLPFPTSFFAKKELAATNALKYLLRLDLA